MVNLITTGSHEGWMAHTTAKLKPITLEKALPDFYDQMQDHEHDSDFNIFTTNGTQNGAEVSRSFLYFTADEGLSLQLALTNWRHSLG